MSLPSVKFLLDQAALLVKYMGDKHRFRLKSASAQEAVAAMYGKHDWNTLHGLATRADGAPAQGATAASRPIAYPVTWNERYEPDLTVTAADWFRHTLADGGSASTRREWLEQQLMSHIERGAPGVFVNVFGAERAGVRDLYGELAHAEAASSPGQVLRVNLMADMEPDDVAAMLVALAFKADTGAADGYWQQSAHRVLAVVAQAMREVGDTVTLERLVELFPLQAPPTRLQHLASQLAPGSSTREHLAGIVESHVSPAGVFSANTWAAHHSVLARSLASLRQEPWADAFLGGVAAPSLRALLAQGKCLGIEWPEQTAHRAGVAVMYALRAALRDRLQTPSFERGSDWVFALGDLTAYLAPALAGMLQQSRSGRVALLMTAGDSRDFERHPAGREILANVWNRVHLRISPEQLAELLARVGGPVLVQSGRLTAPLYPR